MEIFERAEEKKCVKGYFVSRIAYWVLAKRRKAVFLQKETKQAKADLENAECRMKDAQ